jgi:hypothetical protein
MPQREQRMSTVKVSVNLPEESVKALKEIAKRDGVTMTEALRRSISLQQFVEDAQNKGGNILIEDRNNTVQRLVIR